MSSAESPQPTLLLAGRGERMADALRTALGERGISAEQTSVSLLVQRAYVEAPDLIVLIGDGAKDGGRQALSMLAKNAGTAAIPVVLVADSARLGAKIDAFRHGVVAVVARTASVDELAASIASVANDLPERAGEITGGLAETSVDELVELLSEELRSGILSVGAGGASAQVVLEADRPFSEVVGELVEKLRPLVGEAKGAPLSYEFYETPGARLGSLDLELPHDAATDILRGRRLLLIEENAARSDILVQELRAAGAEVVVADGEGNGLARARLLDPEVTIVDGATDTGWALGALRALRRDQRLRWSSLLLTDATQLWQGKEPDVARLASSIAPLVAHDVELTERAKREPAFDVRIEAIGPTRLLRALVSTGLGLRVRLAHPRAVAEIDLSEGLVVGATAQDGDERIEGVAAIATFCALGSGRAQVERKDAPATTNVMTPLTEALAASERETPLVAPSLPPKSDPALPKLAKPGEDPARVVKRLEQLLVRLDNVVAKGMTRAPRMSPTPARPIRIADLEKPGPTPVKPFTVPAEAYGQHETRKHPRLSEAEPPKDDAALTTVGKAEEQKEDTGRYAVDALERLKQNAQKSEPPPAKMALPPPAKAKPPLTKGPRVRPKNATLVGTPSPFDPTELRELAAKRAAKTMALKAPTPSAVKAPTPSAANAPVPNVPPQAVVQPPAAKSERDDEPSMEIQTETWGRPAAPKAPAAKSAPLSAAKTPEAKKPAALGAKPAQATPAAIAKPAPEAAPKKPLRSRQPTLVGAMMPEKPEAPPTSAPKLEVVPETVEHEVEEPAEPVPLVEERVSIEIETEEPAFDEPALRETDLAQPVLELPIEREPVQYVPSEPPPLVAAPKSRPLVVDDADAHPKPRKRSFVLNLVIALMLLVPAAGAAVWFFYFRGAGGTPFAMPWSEQQVREEQPTREPPHPREQLEADPTPETPTPETQEPTAQEPATQEPATQEPTTQETPETQEASPELALAAGAPIEGRDEDFSLQAMGVVPGAARPAAAGGITRLFQLANLRRSREQWEESAATYRQVLAVDPENPRATAGLAMVGIGSRDGRNAVAWAQRLVRLRPDYASNYVLLGDAFEVAGDLTSARRAWTRAHELDEELTSARDRLRDQPE